MREADARDARRGRLITEVRHHATSEECWKQAEVICRTGALRELLTRLGVDVGNRDVAIALMAAARLVADNGPEWGGDYREGAADVATLGLELLESSSTPT